MDKLSERTINERLEKLDAWILKDGAIETVFEFSDFREAFAAMTRIAFECEVLGHHPDWYNVYNRLRIRLSTHDAGGITEKDFELAHGIERIIDRRNGAR